MSRIRISKQLEQSTNAGSIITTDATNEAQYLAPGANGQVLSLVAGVPTWVDASDENRYVDDIAARDALGAVPDGTQAYVEDASADATVASGGALYVYDAGNTQWRKIAEFESLDVASNTQDSEDFTPAAAATTVTLANTPAAGSNVEVHRNGLRLPTAEWSITGAVITLTLAIGASTGGAGGETITVDYEY